MTASDQAAGSTRVIRLLLAEDQTLIREALAALLSFEPDMEVVAQVGRGDEVVKAAVEHDIDVALLDIEMPGMDGLAAADQLHRAQPGVKIVILTTFGRPGFLRRAMESGVSAFIVKDSPPDRLATAVRKALAGERVIDPDLAAAALAEGINPLTPRERDVLAASADGSVITEIAHRLPVRGHRPELPVRLHPEDRRPQSHRGPPDRRGTGLALSRPAASRPGRPGAEGASREPRGRAVSQEAGEPGERAGSRRVLR